MVRLQWKEEFKIGFRQHLKTFFQQQSIGWKVSGLTVWLRKSLKWFAFRLFFLIRIVGGGVQAGSTRHVGHWMAYCTSPGWLWWWRKWWNEVWQDKPKYLEKTCLSATLFTTNPTWPNPGSNSGRRGGKPATNRLSYGAALLGYLLINKTSFRATINFLKWIATKWIWSQMWNCLAFCYIFH
jgi:hypothetical protein